MRELQRREEEEYWRLQADVVLIDCCAQLKMVSKGGVSM